jgi:hypothetical protein
MFLKLRRQSCIIAGLAFCVLGHAQNHEPLSSNTLSLRVGVTTPAIPLSLAAPTSNGSAPSLEYNQNSNSKFGIGVDYKWLGFFISVSDVQSELDTALYGDTKYIDFQLHTYFESFGFDFYAQDFRGYYLSNTEAVTSQECCLLREDLDSQFLGANVFYLFSPERMSLIAAGNLTAVQKKSGGSWMAYLGYAAQRFKSDATLAPAGFETDYGLLGNLEEGTFQTFAVGGGYGYTGVIAGNFFIHLSGMIGIGPQQQRFQTRDFGSYDQWNGATKASMRNTIGWSGKRTFGALQILFDSTSFQLEGEILTLNSILTFLSGGIRFDI